MDYRIKKDNKIVYCILDNIENQYGQSSKETAKNISDYFISKTVQRNYDIFISNTTDNLIERASSDTFYTHAVVVITGTHLGLSDRLFQFVEEKCKEHFTIAGHILDRGDAYYEIHNQFFILNLQEYKRIGSPKMGDVDWNKEHTKIEPIRSKECINGDIEIPVWVKQGNKEKKYSQQRHGWNFINVALNNNAIFCDLGDNIRKSKNYLYYEYDHVYYRHVPDLFQYQLICNSFVAPWNSDNLPNGLDCEGPIDHYITTGTGLNWVYNLAMLGYHKNTYVTFTDVSDAVLSFMKLLVEEWNGVDYPKFYIDNIKFIPEGYDVNLDEVEQNIRNWWELFKTNFNDFSKLWKNIKKLNFDYKLMDFFAHTEYKFITPGQNTFVNVSDAFNHVPYIHSANVKFRLARENNLIETIKAADENIWLYIPTRLADFFNTDTNHIHFGRVKDFHFSDINNFNMPPWHQHEWKSYCPMTNQTRILK